MLLDYDPVAMKEALGSGSSRTRTVQNLLLVFRRIHVFRYFMLHVMPVYIRIFI